MTKLERRIHRLIEKAIVEHGYLVECIDGAGGCFGYIDEINRRCCAVGAIGVALGLDDGHVGRHQISQRSGIDANSLREICAGFECGQLDFTSPMRQFGYELRQRYVVQQ